jgi:hypothetical protein
VSNVSHNPLVDPNNAIVVAAGAACMALFAVGSSLFGVPAAAAGVAGLIAMVICNQSAKLSVVAVLLAICFSPYWWGLVVGGYLPVAAIVALAVLPGALVRGVRRGNYAVATVLVLSALVALLVASGASMPGHGFVFLGQWVPAFVVGYALAQQVGLGFIRDAVTVIFTAVAILAIIEYFADWNPFFGTAPNTEQYLKLGTLQSRGGVTRAEWAFGHSIALANSLALAIPMVLTSRFRSWIRALAIALIVVGILTTFSRSGLISAALALALTLWASRSGDVSRGMRVGVPAVIIVTAVVALPWVDRVFGAASTETARSAAHRLTLLDMLPYLNAFGTATGYHESGGVFNWFGVISIDNAFLRLAVNFGWIFGLLCLLPAGWVLVRAAARRASPPEVALASIVPALLTVALITQFGILVFFYIGVAAAMARGSSTIDLTTESDPRNESIAIAPRQKI